MLVVIAVVVAVCFVVSDAALSLPINPLYLTVSTGFAVPYTFVLSSAVTVSTALVTVNVPAT